jgi:hypothetical protein
MEFKRLLCMLIKVVPLMVAEDRFCCCCCNCVSDEGNCVDDCDTAMTTWDEGYANKLIPIKEDTATTTSTDDDDNDDIFDGNSVIDDIWKRFICIKFKF